MLEKKEIKHVAALARIGLKEKEIERYQKELSQVLDYFEKLKDLNTESTDTIGHITGMHSIFREDNIEDCEESVKNGIMENAPRRKDDYFQVKSIL